MADPQQLDANEQHKWLRISPIAIVYFVAQAIKAFASNFIYILPAIAVSFSKIKENPGVWLPLLAGLLGLLIISALLQYWFFSFRLVQNTIEIRSGVFAKKHLNLPFTRVQNVTLEQPIYYRLNQSVCMILDTAGSVAKEAKLIALPLDVAEQLKKQIVSQNAKPTSEEQDNPGVLEQQSETVLNTRSLKDLIIHGITNNRVWIIIGVMAPIYDNMASYFASGLDYVGIDLQHYFDTQTQTGWQLTLAFLSLLFIVVTLVGIISILGSILMFYDFKLTRSEDRYIRRSGLLTKQESTMRLSRLQVIAAKQDWLDVLLGRVNLELKQNNAGVINPNDGQKSNKILVPSVKPVEVKEMARDALPDNQMYSMQYSPVSRRFIVRQAILWVLPLSTVVALISFANDSNVGFWVSPVLFSVFMFLVWCRWKRWGYANDETYMYIRKGGLGVDYYCFPIYKIQQTRYVQSLFMRRNKLANIQFVLASGAISLPFIKQQQAQTLLGEGIEQVSRQKRSWM